MCITFSFFCPFLACCRKYNNFLFVSPSQHYYFVHQIIVSHQTACTWAVLAFDNSVLRELDTHTPQTEVKLHYSLVNQLAREIMANVWEEYLASCSYTDNYEHRNKREEQNTRYLNLHALTVNIQAGGACSWTIIWQNDCIYLAFHFILCHQPN